MKEEGFVLEIRRGQGEPRFLRLPRGTDLQPTSFGARADFRVDADGVLDVHGFVYFDGHTLFVQSAEAAAPVRVNGRPAGAEWSPVDPPATLAFGDARLVFCPASQASTVSSPVAARPAAGARPVASKPAPRVQMEDLPTIADVPPPMGAYDDVLTERVAPPEREARLLEPADEDSTHNIPLPSHVGGGHVGEGRMFPASEPEPPPEDDTTRALPLPAAVMPVAPVARPLPPVIVAPSPAEQSGPIAAPPPAPPRVEKPKPLDEIKKQWKEASLPKKAIAFLLPVAFVMVVFGLDDDGPAPAKKARPSASGSSSVVATKATASATPDEEDPKKDAVEPAPPKATAPAVPAASGKPVLAASSSTSKTPERAAVDAVAAGSLIPAAELYDQLAKEHPENPAYKEAARILRAKAKK